MPRRLFDLFFYGHVWIALAAAALGWQTSILTGADAVPGTVHLFLFLATLGVYTLHRWLSYQRAGVRSDFARYRLVQSHPRTSLAVGVVSLLASLYLLVAHLPNGARSPLLAALPFTGFYLIPLWPGGPRLRDLPYLKTVWVAVAWTLMTVALPYAVQVATLAEGAEVTTAFDWHKGDYLTEVFVRFPFIAAVALAFDFRDVELDRKQGVHTVAADYPEVNLLLIGVLCAASGLLTWAFHEVPTARYLPIAYAGAGGFLLTAKSGSEDHYATIINGVLLFPPAALIVYWLIGL